jgi:hypothetical protein
LFNERQLEWTKLNQDLEALQKQLNDNETYRALNAMEQRIRHLESVAFHLREGMQHNMFCLWFHWRLLIFQNLDRHETEGDGK